LVAGLFLALAVLAAAVATAWSPGALGWLGHAPWIPPLALVLLEFLVLARVGDAE
jgi:hypothetical protein